jgi:preprotein translocase subunit SecF
MEFVKPGTYIDFMRHRRPVVGMSLVLVVASLVSLFVPGPKFGIDFAGGTEIQVRFQGDVGPNEVRTTMEELGYDRPEVVSVQGSPNEYMIRVREISSLTKGEKSSITKGLKGLGASLEQDPQFSPGGDKVSLQFESSVEPSAIETAIEEAGVQVRSVNQFGQSEENRYEARLVGVGDKIVDQMQEAFGKRGPEKPRRIEWVGPEAGEQLRDAAIKALLYAIAFIMVYVAFRFDLRFAPGGVLAMLHDALITLGIYVLVQKEINLTTVAALLTIIGYSINDTIVVYDRIRENMGRLKDKSLAELINISTSQMLGRTIVTSGTTLVSVFAFFIWGTPVIRDITFALLVGILIGTYSSVYIAAPVTEWMDRRFFNRVRKD